MKIAIFTVIGLMSLAANCVLYGWLESSVNMIQGLGELFKPGATTVIFSPILLLFILLTLGVFISGPLAAVALLSIFGGVLLRSLGLTLSRSFVRWFVLVTVVCQFAIVLFAVQQNAPFLLRRPQLHPAVPAYVMAILAAANAAMNSVVSGIIVRRMTSRQIADLT